jgi:uncharacterized protein
VTEPEADANYLALRGAVDAHAERVYASHELACRAGCTACCRQDLSVSIVEADTIFGWLRHHGVGDACSDRTAVDDHPLFESLALDDACMFLGREGLCTIYPVRPIICRSHGLPLQVDGGVDVCPVSLPLQESPTVLDLEGLNLRLALIAQLYDVGEGVHARVGRVALSEVRASALGAGVASWYL